MKIVDFIEWIKQQRAFINRGLIIDKLAHLTDNWIIALKSLLIKNIQTTISKFYLLGKLRFMERHPDKPYLFLDGFGIRIYKAIKDYNNL